ncbi:MAG TPA: hypothetical protein VGX28_15055 [Frankiaceae bacterium]|jgi:hypothetical protein|nr:hypothetical protein [Frankiaceae bacterium]
MRRLLVLAAVTAAFAGVAPAANAYLYNGCQPGDWTAANVVVAGREVAQVCTSQNPVVLIRQIVAVSKPCTKYTC